MEKLGSVKISERHNQPVSKISKKRTSTLGDC